MAPDALRVCMASLSRVTNQAENRLTMVHLTGAGLRQAHGLIPYKFLVMEARPGVIAPHQLSRKAFLRYLSHSGQN